MEGTYDKESALQKVRSLKVFDDGNSMTNLLWWIHSKGDDEIKREREREKETDRQTENNLIW